MKVSTAQSVARAIDCAIHRIERAHQHYGEADAIAQRIMGEAVNDVSYAKWLIDTDGESTSPPPFLVARTQL
jgi:hypothetical protein